MLCVSDVIIYLFDFAKNLWILFVWCRVVSPPRRTMAERKENFDGLKLREHYMALNQRKPLVFPADRTMKKFPQWQNWQRGKLRLRGLYPLLHKVNLSSKFQHKFSCSLSSFQAARAAHSQGSHWITCEGKRPWSWFNQHALHHLKQLDFFIANCISSPIPIFSKHTMCILMISFYTRGVW